MSEVPADRQSDLPRRWSNTAQRTATLTREITEDLTDLLDIPYEPPERGQAPRIVPSPTEAEPPPQAEPSRPRKVTAEEFSREFLDPDRIMLKDKLVFFAGVVNVALIGFWVGHSPSTYYHYWTAKCSVLFPLRWWTYRKQGLHYLMLELCYVGNLLGILHVYVFPGSPYMRKLLFAYGAGPLLWSILAMRNSLVFHDFDKMTTLMMHASPAITAWTLRWYPHANDPLAALTSSYAGMILPSVACYVAWMLTYYLLTFVAFRGRIEGRGRQTMFSLMVPKKDPERAKRSPLARLVLMAPEWAQPFAYLAFHALAATLAFQPVKIFWDHYWVHTVALLFCLGLSVWNGANYYFKVFAKKYLAQLEAKAGKPLTEKTKAA